MSKRVSFVSGSERGEYIAYTVENEDISTTRNIGTVVKHPDASPTLGGVWMAYDLRGEFQGWHRTRKAAGDKLDSTDMEEKAWQAHADAGESFM